MWLIPVKSSLLPIKGGRHLKDLNVSQGRVILSEKNLFSYLLDRKICLEDDLSPSKVTPLDGKNFNLKVEFLGGRSLLVKQTTPDFSGSESDGFLGDGTIACLATNALKSWQNHTVLPLDRDPANGVLVLPFLNGYESLADYYDRSTFSLEVAQQVGAILGEMHQLTHNQLGVLDILLEIDPELEPAAMPYFLQSLPPLTPEDFGRIRTDALVFFQAYGKFPQLPEAIAALGEIWQPTCLVHQDLRLENWLIAENRSADLRLIDWEALGWGDPLADLGHLLAEYLSLWTDSIPRTSGIAISERLAQADLPLSQLQPSLGAVIAGYRQAFPEIVSARSNWLEIVGRYCGRALIEHIVVRMQYMLPIDSVSLCNLQLGNSLLCQSQKAVSTLFGVSS
jgi:Phosphotransferase enzyme family